MTRPGVVNRAFADVEWFEHRADRSYDEQDGGCLIHPNGTKVVSFDRDFLGAATREVLVIYRRDAA